MDETLKKDLMDFLLEFTESSKFKLAYFKSQEKLYNKILNTCFINIRQENEETEKCIQNVLNEFNPVKKIQKEIYQRENNKLAECLENNGNSSRKENLNQCINEFKKSYSESMVESFREFNTDY